MRRIAGKTIVFTVVLGLLAFSGARWPATAEAGHYITDPTRGFQWAAVQRTSGSFTGLKGVIQTGNPQIRNAGLSHNNFSAERLFVKTEGPLCPGDLRPWLEVGWDKQKTFQSPKFYYYYLDFNCQAPPDGPIHVFAPPVVDSFYSYKIEYQGDNVWDACIGDPCLSVTGGTGINLGWPVANFLEAGGEVRQQPVPGDPAWVWHNEMGLSAVLNLQYKSGGVWTNWDATLEETVKNIHRGYILHPSFAPYNNFDNYGYNWEGTSLLKQRVTANGQAVAHSGMESVAVPLPLGLGLFSFRDVYNTWV